MPEIKKTDEWKKWLVAKDYGYRGVTTYIEETHSYKVFKPDSEDYMIVTAVEYVNEHFKKQTVNQIVNNTVLETKAPPWANPTPVPPADEVVVHEYDPSTDKFVTKTVKKRG